MAKLLAQVLFLAVVLYVARTYGLGFFGLLVAGVTSIATVHIVYERLLGSLGGEGPMAVRDDDPLMVEAIQTATGQWGAFVGLASTQLQNAVVKFRVRTDDGAIENVWGDVLDLRDDGAAVRVRTRPIGAVSSLDLQRAEIPLADIIDWQVVHEDNTLSGGYTQRAAFKILERDSGSMPAKFAAEIARYRNFPESPT